MNNQLAPPLPHSRSASPAPQYALRKGLGFWELTFAGHHAIFKHEHGAYYVAYLLLHPPQQPIHALDLAAKIPEIYRRQLGLSHLTDPTTGQTLPLQTNTRIQQRSLALDDAQTLQALLRKEKELEAILDDDTESEPVKQEALRELEAIAQFQRQHGRRSVDNAQRAAYAVRQAIKRFHKHLHSAMDTRGAPHPLLRPFANHLDEYLLIPSVRYSGHGGPHNRAGCAGCFTYEPPPGVSWTDGSSLGSYIRVAVEPLYARRRDSDT